MIVKKHNKLHMYKIRPANLLPQLHICCDVCTYVHESRVASWVRVRFDLFIKWSLKDDKCSYICHCLLGGAIKVDNADVYFFFDPGGVGENCLVLVCRSN